ncbi:MAG: NDMA-dependent alcohol dehydrogenase [Actinomycetota bacterium]|nr:NDMA-dependent alcohol dehydrogenase [Actinomycetota bacterium]
MKSQAAVLRGVGKEWEIQEVDLDPPRAGEVLVKTAVAGICHSDDHFATGDTVPSEDMVAMARAAGVPMPSTFPMIGGHEGAGVVVEVGEGVRTLAVGDHVATSFIPACGSCRWCVTGQSNICDVGAHLNDKEMTTDGTVRRHLGDESLLAMMQVGTFSEYVVASERSIIKIDDAIPFHAGALVSCGATTGWGSATVSAGTETGDTVVVIGVGGVGMSAVQGARAAGASRIIAVDPVESKRSASASFGATHASPSAGEAIELVRGLTQGLMADRVVITAGVVHTDLIPVAMMLTRKGGTCVLTGVVPLAEFSVPMMLTDMIYSNKQLKGALYGEMNPRVDIPRLLSIYQSGGLKLDEMVTRRYRLDQINEAIDDLRSGRNIRGVIDFELN